MEEELWHACSAGDVGRVKALLSPFFPYTPGAPPPPFSRNFQDPEFGRSPFYRACGFAGNLEIVRFLSQDPGVDVNLPMLEGASPFFIACQQGHVDIIRFLLADPRINVNGTTDEGATPFYVACEKGHVDIITLLSLDPRVDVTRPTSGGHSPFFIACQYGHVDIVRFLSQDPRIDINFPQCQNATPFYVACQNGNLEVVRLLLSHPGLDLNREMIGGFTPFYVACEYGHVELVQELLKKENLSLKAAQDGTTPLWIAAQQNQGHVVNVLLASGRELEIGRLCEFNRTTAAGCAKLRGNEGIARLLDEFERDPKRVRVRLRRDLGIIHDIAADVFALMVFFSDEFLSFQALS